MVVKDRHPLLAKRVDADFIWMSDEPLLPGKEYLIKCGTRVTPGRIETVSYKTNVNSMETEITSELAINEIGRVVLNTNDALIFDPYTDIRESGCLIVIDRLTNVTVGAGLLRGKSLSELKHGGREYSSAEKALNGYIREHFPEWGCKAI